jgi:hypothetical protein
MAGATLGFLKLVLGFDTVAFKKGMTQAERELTVFSKKMEKFGKGMADVGKAMSIGITAPLVAFGGLAFKAASDANELQSAFNVTFGAMSADMQKWAEETGDAMGRSTQIMEEAANTFGIFFNTAVPPAKAAEMAKTFAVLAQDLGSFFNVDPSVAMEKLRAGLSGESEPLRTFGVFLNEAAVQAKGVELGLVKVGGTMTDQQKIVARYNLILEATTKAQGDVARTSDSTANQVVRAKSAYQELSVVVGTKLLPILTPLIDKLATAMDSFSRLDPLVQTVTLSLLAVAAAAGPLIYLIGNLIKTFAAVKVVALFTQGLLGLASAEAAAASGAVAAGIAINTMLLPLGLATAAVGSLYLAWRNWEKITAIVAALHGAVRNYLGPTLTTALENLLWPIRAVYQAFKALMNLMGATEKKETKNTYMSDVGASFARLNMEMKDAATAKAPAAAAAIGKVGKAAKDSGDAAKKAAEEWKSFWDGLFPEQAAIQKFEADQKSLKARLDAGKISADDYTEALKRLTDQFNALPEEPPGWWEAGPQNSDFWEAKGIFAPDVPDAAEIMGDIGDANKVALDKMGDLTKTKTQEMADAFGTMGAEAVGHMKEMVTAFQGGDILGGIQKLLETVLNVVKLLGQVGVFGGGAAPATAGVAGARAGFGGYRAMGGPVVPGKSYMVGENGPEWFSSKKRGYINPGKEAAPTRVIVVPSPYFDTVVDHRAANVAAPMAGQAAIIGVTGSEARMVRRSRRNLLAA